MRPSPNKMTNQAAYANYQTFCERLNLPPANPLFWEAISEPRVHVRGSGGIPRCSAPKPALRKRKKRRYLNRKPWHDLTGQRFGRLLAIKYCRGGRWLCVCDCGKKRKVRTNPLRQGRSTSCGCKRAETLQIRGKLLGKWAALGTNSHSPEYHAFMDARSRCTDEKNNKRNWHNYGGRGIRFSVQKLRRILPAHWPTP